MFSHWDDVWTRGLLFRVPTTLIDSGFTVLGPSVRLFGRFGTKLVPDSSEWSTARTLSLYRSDYFGTHLCSFMVEANLRPFTSLPNPSSRGVDRGSESVVWLYSRR